MSLPHLPCRYARTHISYYHGQNTPLSLSILIAAPPPSLLLITVATSKKIVSLLRQPNQNSPSLPPLFYINFFLCLFSPF